MKTKLFFILAVLITVSMQAQIPTLVDKNYTLIKKSDGKETKKLAKVLDELKKSTKDNIEVKNQTIENNEKEIQGKKAGIDTKEKENIENLKKIEGMNYAVATKRNALEINKSKIADNEAAISANNNKIIFFEKQILEYESRESASISSIALLRLNGQKNSMASQNDKLMQTNAGLKSTNEILEGDEKKLLSAIEQSKNEIRSKSAEIENFHKDIEQHQSVISQSKSDVADSKAKLKVIQDISNDPAVKSNLVPYANTLAMYKEYFRLKKDSIATEVSKLKTVEINGISSLSLDTLKGKIKALKKLNREADRTLRFLEKEETGVFMPSLNYQFGSVFFKKLYYTDGKTTNYLNTLALNYSNSGVLAQSEVLADTFGPVRIGFGTLIQSNSETPETPEEKEEQQEEDQLENLINGGGNFYLETILPTFLYSLEDFTTYFYVNNKTGLGLKGFSDSVDTSTFNSAFGMNFYMGANTAEKKFNFFVSADVNYNIASKAVYENLNMDDKKPFMNGKIIAGVTFDQKFRLTARVLTFGSDESLRSSNIVVGLQIIPQKN